MRRKNKNAASEAHVSALVPSAMDLSREELKLRLDWIEREISQLSSLNGVSDRLQALRFSRSQLLATDFLKTIMGRSMGAYGKHFTQGGA